MYKSVLSLYMRITSRLNVWSSLVSAWSFLRIVQQVKSLPLMAFFHPGFELNSECRGRLSGESRARRKTHSRLLFLSFFRLNTPLFWGEGFLQITFVSVWYYISYTDFLFLTDLSFMEKWPCRGKALERHDGSSPYDCGSVARSQGLRDPSTKPADSVFSP